MAYSRAPGVYFYGASEGFVCVGCRLMDTRPNPPVNDWSRPSWTCKTHDEAIAHLQAHDPEDVDEEAIPELIAEKGELPT